MSFAPWDMDASFGRSIDASEFKGSYDGLMYENHIITQIVDVDKSFLSNVASRYFELRKTVLATDSIKSRFDEYFEMFEETGAAQREYDRWSGADGIELDFVEEQKFVHQYIDIRMAFLDEYYGSVNALKNIPSELSDGAIYDIWGRRVYNLQPAHIYIKNGRCLYFRR